MLQVELCMPCSDDNSVLYAETHNTLLPKSACEIAHQTELVDFITNNSKVVTLRKIIYLLMFKQCLLHI